MWILVFVSLSPFMVYSSWYVSMSARLSIQCDSSSFYPISFLCPVRFTVFSSSSVFASTKGSGVVSWIHRTNMVTVSIVVMFAQCLSICCSVIPMISEIFCWFQSFLFLFHLCHPLALIRIRFKLIVCHFSPHSTIVFLLCLWLSFPAYSLPFSMDLHFYAWYTFWFVYPSVCVGAYCLSQSTFWFVPYVVWALNHFFHHFLCLPLFVLVILVCFCPYSITWHGDAVTWFGDGILTILSPKY